MFKFALFSAALCCAVSTAAYAQESTETSSEEAPVDEVIAYGQRGQSGNRAMRAFNAGDYATAEIEFENHFQSLKRSERAVKRAARTMSNADISAQLSSGLSQVSSAGGSTDGGSSAPTISLSSTSASNAASSSNIQAITSLNDDGKITYEDFGFSRYMSGLSQIQLGKFVEAKESFSESLEHNYRNYDARMRLGLLELRDGNYEAAGNHLKRLDKQRRACGNGCKDLEALNKATLTLGKALSASPS